MAEERYSSEIGIPDEHFRLIGIIAAEWERLDFLLEWAVAEIGLHDPIDVALLTINLSYTAKIELILTYASAIKKDAPEEWKGIYDCIQEIRRVNKLRSTYVHARWIPSEKPGGIPERSVARTSQGKLDLGNKPTPASELAQAARDIRAAAERFMIIMNGYGLLKAVPKTQS